MDGGYELLSWIYIPHHLPNIKGLVYVQQYKMYIKLKIIQVHCTNCILKQEMGKIGKKR